MHAFIGYSFFGKKYANELCILPKRPDCNFKQTLVHINYARGWEKCLKSFKTIHSAIVKILPYSWLIISYELICKLIICKLAHYDIICIGLYNLPMHDQTLTQHEAKKNKLFDYPLITFQRVGRSVGIFFFFLTFSIKLARVEANIEDILTRHRTFIQHTNER